MPGPFRAAAFGRDQWVERHARAYAWLQSHRQTLDAYRSGWAAVDEDGRIEGPTLTISELRETIKKKRLVGRVLLVRITHRDGPAGGH